MGHCESGTLFIGYVFTLEFLIKQWERLHGRKLIDVKHYPMASVYLWFIEAYGCGISDFEIKDDPEKEEVIRAMTTLNEWLNEHVKSTRVEWNIVGNSPEGSPCDPAPEQYARDVALRMKTELSADKWGYGEAQCATAQEVGMPIQELAKLGIEFQDECQKKIFGPMQLPPSETLPEIRLILEIHGG